MNYRHAFHAGSFADVHKHAVLARIITHLAEKSTPFRVLDTHAGAGLYNLGGPEAGRTAEWRDGVGRLRQATLAPDVGALLAPYLDALQRYNAGDRLTAYPGSPALAQALLRPQDRLIACELEPASVRQLAITLGPDRRTKALAIDGWTALAAYIPPKERRGLVLIDPPFERPDEFRHAAEALAAAHHKWPTGVYQMWYPIKRRSGPDLLARALVRAGLPRLLRTELLVAPAVAEDRLVGSGMIVVNPPWRLRDELALLGPALAALLGSGGASHARLDWLSGER